MANENPLGNLDQLIQARIEKVLEETSKTVAKDYTESDIEDLKQRKELFSKKYTFQKNGIVKWKKGLKNRRLPMENQPAIVIDILNPPLLSTEEESGSTYFREPLDILLGFINEKDGEFIVFHYDSKRFEHYETK
jgi:hypothetical protein